MGKKILQKIRILAQSLVTKIQNRYGPASPWVAGGASLFMFGMVAAFGTVQDAGTPIAQRAVLEPLPISIS